MKKETKKGYEKEGKKIARERKARIETTKKKTYKTNAINANKTRPKDGKKLVEK